MWMIISRRYKPLIINTANDSEYVKNFRRIIDGIR